MKDFKWLVEHEKVTTEDLFDALKGDVVGKFRLFIWSENPKTLGTFEQVVDLVSYNHSSITEADYVDNVFVSTLNEKGMNYVAACELLRYEAIRDALAKMISTPTLWTNRGSYFQQEWVYHHSPSATSIQFRLYLLAYH